MSRQVLAALAAVALASSGCELTYPWSEAPPPPTAKDRAKAARLQVQPGSIETVAVPGESPGTFTLSFTVTGLQEGSFLDVKYEGPAVASATPSPLGTATVAVELAGAASPAELTGSVTLNVCLDLACTLPIGGSPKTIPVQVHVRSAVLQATPAAVDFAWTRGTMPPDEVQVAISETGGVGARPATVTVVHEDAATGWLTAVLPLGATQVPGTLYVQLQPVAVPAGEHRARVRVEAANTFIEIPVKLVATVPELSASPESFTFTAVRGQAALPPADLTQLSITGGVAFQLVPVVEYITGQTDWLTAPAVAQVPGQLSLRPNRTDLLPGTHDATVRLLGEGNVELGAVPVHYVVSAPPPSATPAPAAVTFQAFAGQAFPPFQKEVALSTPFSVAVPYVASLEYGAGASGWLAQPPGGVAPGPFSVRPGRTDLAPGTYTATVRLRTPGGAALGALAVTYELAEPLVVPDRTSVALLASQVERPPLRSDVVLLSTGADVPVGWEAVVDYGAGPSGWLSVPASGTAPGALNVALARNDLPTGIYEALLHVRRPGGADYAAISVRYELIGPYVTSTPDHLTFVGALGQAEPPPAQTLTLAPHFAPSWQCGAGWETPWANFWFELSGTFTAPGTITVRPSSLALPAGVYDAVLVITGASSGAALGRVPVTYTVSGPPLTTVPERPGFTVTQASPPSSLTTSVALDDGGTPRTFSVVSKPSWLTVTPATGTTGPGATLALGLDLASIGLYSFGIQGTLVLRSTPVGGGPTADLPVTVTADVSLPSVKSVSPSTVGAGDVAPLVVRGVLVDILLPGSLRFGATPAASVSPVDFREASVVPPILAPGTYTVAVTNGLGLDTGHASLTVAPAGPAAAASGPSRAGVRTAVVRDDARGAVYAANTAGFVERWRDAAGLALESIAPPGVMHLALSPDGARLVAVTADALWEIDPVAFVLPAAPERDLSWTPRPSDWRLAFGNDGRGYLVNAGAELRSPYEVRTDGTTSALEAWLYGTAGSGIAAARDGSRVIVTRAGGTPFRIDAGTLWDVTPLPPADRPETDRTGRRILPSTTGAPQLHDQDFQPIAGTLGAGTVAALLDDAGLRAFTVDGLGRVHVWDVSTPVAGGGTYPELGTPGGVLPAVSPGAGVRLARSVDGKTLYLVGDSALVVLPLGG